MTTCTIYLKFIQMFVFTAIWFVKCSNWFVTLQVIKKFISSWRCVKRNISRHTLQHLKTQKRKQRWTYTPFFCKVDLTTTLWRLRLKLSVCSLSSFNVMKGTFRKKLKIVLNDSLNKNRLLMTHYQTLFLRNVSVRSLTVCLLIDKSLAISNT